MGHEPVRDRVRHGSAGHDGGIGGWGKEEKGGGGSQPAMAREDVGGCSGKRKKGPAERMLSLPATVRSSPHG